MMSKNNKFPNIVLLMSFLISCWLTSCSTENAIWNDPDKPVENTPANNVGSETTEPMDRYYTSQSTVSDVINDPVFGSFGRLLFPVDRNVPPSMTLAQVSTSNVYMWYPYIQVENTVEILNYLHSQAANGEQIFHSIYSADEIAQDRSKKDTGLFVFKGEIGNPFAITNAGGGLPMSEQCTTVSLIRWNLAKPDTQLSP